MTLDVKKVVVAYLLTHKRLVIPQLGAFIVKEPGRSVLFSELFKRDDGVLRKLLMAEGMGEIEAAGAIDRLVFDLRHAALNGAGYLFYGLGLFTAGPDGTLSFAYDPHVGDATPDPATPAPAADQTDPSAPVAGNAEKAARPDAEDRVPSVDAPAAADERPARGQKPLYAPDPYVKGLTYGRPIKTTDAYTFVGHKAGKRHVDKFIIVAIIAALLAVGVIVYAYIRESQAKREAAAFMEEMTEIVSGETGDASVVEE